MTARLAPKTLAILHEIQDRWDEHGKQHRELWLWLGEKWYQVRDDPAVARGDLKTYAAFFTVSPDHLTRCMRLWLTRDDLSAVDTWAATNDIRNEYPGTVFGEQELHRRWKNRFRTVPTRLAEPVWYGEISEPKILHGDAREKLLGLADASVDCVVTSPPYHGISDYKVKGALGTGSVAEYLNYLIEVFRQLLRILRPDGTVWLNLDDRYAASARKSVTKYTAFNISTCFALAEKDDVPRGNMLLIPQRLIIRLQEQGWIINNDIKWIKPASVRETRPSRCVHRYETVYLLSKGNHYYNTGYRLPAKYKKGISSHQRQLGGVPRDIIDKAVSDVWEFTPEHVPGHPTAFPLALAERCLALGCKPGGHALDPFCGSGTTGVAAKRLKMQFTGIDLNGSYCELARKRIAAEPDPESVTEAAD